MLLAIVTLREGEAGRHYRLATEADYHTCGGAEQRLANVAHEKLPGGLSVIPDEPTPVGGGSGITLSQYRNMA